MTHYYRWCYYKAHLSMDSPVDKHISSVLYLQRNKWRKDEGVLLQYD